MTRHMKKAIKNSRANDQWYHIKSKEVLPKFSVGDLIYDPRDDSVGVIVKLDTKPKYPEDHAYKCLDTSAGEIRWFDMSDIDANCEFLENTEKNT